METEAYVGPLDAASHARSGPTGRAATMFGPPGFAYVYLIYGMYHCFNAVTERPGFGAAVLVRAVEPVQAILPEERTSGPGLLCRALRIDRACTGVNLTGKRLFLEDAPPLADTEVRMGGRVGVAYAGEWADRPWRFWDAASPWVSRPREGAAFNPSVLAVPE